MVSDHLGLFLSEYAVSDNTPSLGDQDIITDSIQKLRMLSTESKPSSRQKISASVKIEPIPQ